MTLKPIRNFTQHLKTDKKSVDLDRQHVKFKIA